MAKNTKDVDKDFWISQVNAGKDFRKKYAKQQMWDTWRAYYRGDFQAHILPVNLFFTMIRTVVPRVYFRNPGISVTPARPGPLHAAFAQILERVDNKLIRQMKIKNQLKRIVQDSFMFGTGIGKLGFGAEYSPTPDLGAGDTAAPMTGRKKDERIEYSSLVRPNMPWFMRVMPDHFIVPAGAESFDDLPWVCHEIERPYEDVQADPRFKNTKDLKPTVRKMSATHAIPTQHLIEVIKLYEIRDRKWGRVIVLAEDGTDKPLLVEDDELQVRGEFNFHPLVFNDDGEVFWGIPESQILEPHQLEINEINTLIMRHRRISIVKMLIERGGMDPLEAEKLVSEQVAAVAWTNRSPREVLEQVQASQVPQDLVQGLDATLQIVREQVGFGRNQFGEYYPKSRDVTATEAKIVEQATAIRVDERRDMVADMLADTFRGIHQIVFNHWHDEQVVEIVGPGGVPMWVQFRGSMLREGSYEVAVDPDTMIPETRQMREQKAAQVYAVLKENPLIDPLKLTKYLLRELHGVQYDDMMRGMPQGAGLSQQQPLNVGQYTGVLQQAGKMGMQTPKQIQG